MVLCRRLFQWRGWWRVDSRTTLSSCSGSRNSSMPTMCLGKTTMRLQHEGTSHSVLPAADRQRNQVLLVERQGRQWRLPPQSRAIVTPLPKNQACLAFKNLDRRGRSKKLCERRSRLDISMFVFGNNILHHNILFYS